MIDPHMHNGSRPDTPATYDLLTLDQALDLLVEECSEVIKEVCKYRRFPPESKTHAKWVAAGNLPSRELLAKEVGDLLAAIDVLVYRGFFKDEELRTAKYAKLIRLRERYGVEQVFGPAYTDEQAGTLPADQASSYRSPRNVAMDQGHGRAMPVPGAHPSSYRTPEDDL